MRFKVPNVQHIGPLQAEGLLVRNRRHRRLVCVEGFGEFRPYGGARQRIALKAGEAIEVTPEPAILQAALPNKPLFEECK